MTKEEAFKNRYKDFNGDIDYALPQKWVDQVIEYFGCCYARITGQFVWVYSEQYLFGKPLPITEDADALIKRAPHLF